MLVFRVTEVERSIFEFGPGMGDVISGRGMGAVMRFLNNL